MGLLLHDAVRDADSDRFRQLLIGEMSDVNARAQDGLTALHWAAQEGQVEAVRLLLAAHANPNALGPNRTTPLFSSLFAPAGRGTIALIKAGAAPRARLADGVS